MSQPTSLLPDPTGAAPAEGVAVVPSEVSPVSPETAAVALPVGLGAADEAAAFVAQLFAEMATPEVPSEPALPAVDAMVDAPTEVPAQSEPLADQSWPLQGKQVLVLGLGASGLAMARWALRCGAQVTVADTRSAPPQLAVLQQELPQVRFVAGPLDASLIDGQGVQAVYRSPGLSPAAIAGVVQAAQAICLPVGG